MLLATFQSFGIAVMLFKQPNLVVTSQFEFPSTTVVTLVTGTMFLMWLGEQITERGIGNGISRSSAAVFAGVPSAIGKTLTLTSQRQPADPAGDRTCSSGSLL